MPSVTPTSMEHMYKVVIFFFKVTPDKYNSSTNLYRYTNKLVMIIILSKLKIEKIWNCGFAF